jgi:hypothetical protein
MVVKIGLLRDISESASVPSKVSIDASAIEAYFARRRPD